MSGYYFSGQRYKYMVEDCVSEIDDKYGIPDRPYPGFMVARLKIIPFEDGAIKEQEELFILKRQSEVRKWSNTERAFWGIVECVSTPDLGASTFKSIRVDYIKQFYGCFQTLEEAQEIAKKITVSQSSLAKKNLVI